MLFSHPLIPAKAGTQVCEPHVGTFSPARRCAQPATQIGANAASHISPTWGRAFAGMSRNLVRPASRLGGL